VRGARSRRGSKNPEKDQHNGTVEGRQELEGGEPVGRKQTTQKIIEVPGEAPGRGKKREKEQHNPKNFLACKKKSMELKKIWGKNKKGKPGKIFQKKKKKKAIQTKKRSSKEKKRQRGKGEPSRKKFLRS